MVSQKLLRKTGSRGWMEESRIVGTLSARTKPITARTEPAVANWRFLKMSSKIQAKNVMPNVTQMSDSYMLETGGLPAMRHLRRKP